MDPIDLNDPNRTKVIKAVPADRGVAPDAAPVEPPAAAQKEDERLQAVHGKLIAMYRQELERQEGNRHEMALDEDYYDGIQLTEEDLAVLNKRGQPPTVYNVLAVSMNWVFGSEKRGRTDDKVLPRGKEDAKAAERKTKYMKYLSDVNLSAFHRSDAFEDCAKVGVGWLEVGLQEEDDGEPIYERHESWRNVLWDSAGGKFQDDWRYMFTTRFVDEDVALAMFAHIPGAEEKIKNSVQVSTVLGTTNLMDGDAAMDFGENARETASGQSLQEHKRRRVRLIKAEYRTPEQVDKIVGGVFNGQIYDENDSRHVDEIQSGRASKRKKMMMRMRLAILTPSACLYDAPSIYRHNGFSLTPIWCYRRGRDGMPYGIVRNLRPIQDVINKSASKAQHIMNTNKVLVEEDALGGGMTLDDLADEASAADAMIVLKNGALAAGKIQLNAERGLDQAHIAQFSNAVGMIERVGGVNRDNLGQQTNAESGVAVKARQEEGSLATSGPFDNLRLAHQIHGSKKLSLVEQFATEEKQFRITNMRGQPEFVTMNDGLPENDITRSRADFIISEAEWRATMRQAQVAEFGELLTRMPPEVAMAVLDLLVDEMDLTNRDELVKRIRALNGQKDPDATEPTEEDLANEQAKAMQAQMQQADFELTMQERAAKIEDLKASALKKTADVDVQRSVMFNNNMTGMNSAMSAATQVIQAPTIARVADGIIREGGWKGGLDVPKNLPPPPAAQGLPPPNVQPEPLPPQAAPAPFPPQQ